MSAPICQSQTATAKSRSREKDLAAQARPARKKDGQDSPAQYTFTSRQSADGGQENFFHALRMASPISSHAVSIPDLMSFQAAP